MQEPRGFARISLGSFQCQRRALQREPAKHGGEDKAHQGLYPIQFQRIALIVALCLVWVHDDAKDTVPVLKELTFRWQVLAFRQYQLVLTELCVRLRAEHVP